MGRKLGRLKIARILGLHILLFSFGAYAEAPFCVVTNETNNCFYFDPASCQQAARTLNGICAANPHANQQTFTPVSTMIEHPNMAQSMQQGYAMGQQARLARQQEETNALQQQVLRQQIAAQSRPTSPVVYYNCAQVQGGESFTDQPMVGCTVIFIYR